MHRNPHRITTLALFTLFITLAIPALRAQSAPNENLKDWWKNAVIYEIYPRSFQDTNSDGIGDLNGITAHLDYLHDLGIDAIWISPCYPSPQADFGYDISDYKNIDPTYGTLADFDRLVAEAKKRNIRIMMDMVMNHTSDKHKWFIESRSSKTNPYRDWYVWRDGKGETAADPGQPPNNWLSEFGHSAWQWDATTRQYYYHKFYIQQPDVNWDNPKIHEAFKDIMRFWYKHGVAGFRFDAITTLYEDPNLEDEAYVLDKDGNNVINAYGDKQTDGKKTEFYPKVHDVMVEMRQASDDYPSNKFPGTHLFVGETYVPTIKDLANLYGTPDKPEFQLPMDTQIGLGNNKLEANYFRTKITDAETGLNGNLPLIVFDNHDNPRLDARFGDGTHDTDIQRAISTLLFTTRGTALFYYGDEIGMKTTPPTRKEDVKDPVGITGWPKDKGRDGERTPMQWDASTNAGFSSAAPWLPVPPNYTTINVKAELTDPNSLFNWYKALIHLKKSNDALANGENIMLDQSNPSVLSWLRTSGSNRVLITVNFTAVPQVVNLSTPDVQPKPLTTLLKTPGAKDPINQSHIELGPYGVYIGQL
jgi:alpha-glucosidase